MTGLDAKLVSARTGGGRREGDAPGWVEVEGPGGGGGEEKRGRLGPGERRARAMVTFIYLEILDGQVRTFCKGRWLLVDGLTNRFPGPGPAPAQIILCG